MGKKKKLNPKQRKFAELYATDREFFGNGVQSYIEAYNFKILTKSDYKTAKQCAYRLLTNIDLLAYIDSLIEINLNDAHVDKQLAKLVTQDAEFAVKLGAIKEYNALKTRIKNKLELGVTDELTSLLKVISGKDDLIPESDGLATN
jgi:phage terminase small subunit